MPRRTAFHALLLVVASMIAFPLAAQSPGSCFNCIFNDNPEPPMTTDFDCLTIASGEYGSCLERITAYDPEGNATADECVTYNASYCPANGGGGGGGGGGSGGGQDDQTGECNTGGWGGCPAQCSSCF
jgi:hypothetical protein